MFASGCLACRNPGEHLKLDGLERAGSLGGRHSFHLFVLAVVTLKSAPVSSLFSTFRVPVCANVLRFGRSRRNALKPKTTWLAAAAGCVCVDGEEEKKKHQRGCRAGTGLCEQRETLTLGYEHKRGKTTVRPFTGCAGLCFGISIVCAGKATEMLQRPSIFGQFNVLPPDQANSRSMARALARP